MKGEKCEHFGMLTPSHVILLVEAENSAMRWIVPLEIGQLLVQPGRVFQPIGNPSESLLEIFGHAGPVHVHTDTIGLDRSIVVGRMLNNLHHSYRYSWKNTGNVLMHLNVGFDIIRRYRKRNDGVVEWNRPRYREPQKSF